LNNSIKSSILVIIQFSCIGFLVFNCKFKSIAISALIVLGISILLAFWSIYTMQRSKLKIFPEPSEDAILITEGPYRYIRHPMYTSVLLGCLGFILIYFNFIRLTFFVVLFIDLLVKLHLEEAMLKRKFERYQNYIETTNKLIPLIY
jgi:protein-S-isoprenylcysteine O-methyltransferase Ste14